MRRLRRSSRRIGFVATLALFGTVLTGPPAVALVNYTCNWTTSNYSDGGRGNSDGQFAVDSFLGAHAQGNVSAAIPGDSNSTFAWANVGRRFTLPNNFPSGVTMVAKFLWHVSGYMQADNDVGAYGQARYHFRAGIWNVTSGVQNQRLFVDRTVTAQGPVPQSNDATVQANFNSTNNAVENSARAGTTYRTYIHSRIDIDTTAGFPGVGHARSDFLDTNALIKRAYVDRFRVIFQDVPNAYNFSCPGP